ncbi:MAG: Ig-like domain-containing protein [Gemmatimonadales bacterium]
MLALAVGCGALEVTDEGAAVLEVISPAGTTIAVGGTLQFSARALDKEGNPVAATIRWRTPDTTIAVEESTGLVTGLFKGTGRVQAVTGTEGDNVSAFIASDFFTVTVTDPPSPTPFPDR